MALARRKEPDNLNIAVVPPAVLPAAPGAEEMFAQLYTRYQKVGMDHAVRFLSKTEAQDVVTDALSELWEAWPSLPLEKRTKAYCLGAIHHHILARLKENRRVVSLEDTEAELTHLAIHAIDSPPAVNIEAAIMDFAVDHMPPQRRSVFLLLLEGVTYKEIGERLSLSLGTVNTHVRLARDDIRAAALRYGGFALVAGRITRLPAESMKEATDV